MHRPLTLFILKKFHGYGSGASHPTSNGLRKSAMFVVDMLRCLGYRAELEIAIDGNSIDRIVTEYRPARVVIEAIWVTPAKMEELIRLHPRVRWTVRIHSETPFLANEGTAVAWIAGYMALGIDVGFNSCDTADDFRILGETSYLPNYYPICEPRPYFRHGREINVGCFGAIRPLKNQLIQAMGAVRFAKLHKLNLTFHINGSRLEQSGENNLKNIKALFQATGYKLEMHPWTEHHEFLELVGRMDICLQVSLSESFNIVSADAVSLGVPLIGSAAIGWLPKRSQADVSSSDRIAEAMGRAGRVMVWENHVSLKRYLHGSVSAWKDWIK